MTQAQNAFDERYFELYVNPFLHQLRTLTSDQVSSGASVLVIGCGTGEQCALLAQKCTRLVGLEPDEKHVAETKSRLADFTECQSSINQCDYSGISQFKRQEFDYAVLMMTIHEVNWEKREPLLEDALHAAKKVIVTDYVVPQPRDPHGAVARTAELLAGRKHFSNYQSFQKLGGLRSLEENLGVKPRHRILNNVKTAEVVVYSRK